MGSATDAPPEPELIVDREIDKPVAWGESFGRVAPLVLEIGTGNGIYLVAEAARRPEVNFIGVERAGEFFTKFKKRIIREGVANVRCLRADIEDMIPAAFEPESLTGIVCNHSDPWPKRKHRLRRVLRDEMLARLEPCLAAGATFRFRSDVGWLFNYVITNLRRRAGWKIVSAGPREMPNVEAGEVVTNFERKARDAGGGIWGVDAMWMGEEKIETAEERR